mmetsp:Transcript_10203/g.30796  ORF Transcript_10203/g.30796 Transcript_10203/m.30796 type:complete len:204 (-) Transcript_10203:484-1095(-)
MAQPGCGRFYAQIWEFGIHAFLLQHFRAAWSNLDLQFTQCDGHLSAPPAGVEADSSDALLACGPGGPVRSVKRPITQPAPCLVAHGHKRGGPSCTSTTMCRMCGAYHLTRSMCATCATHAPRSGSARASACSSHAAAAAHSATASARTFSCTCSVPPADGRSAATAVAQPPRLDGNRPSDTRSATPTGATTVQSPSRTSHRSL